ncbi:hypothetical protein PV325_000617 [Microctonus aethiopoides]|nr:hypothetical protein PV325_000617 [Microctonus aethiopoides]KAK0094785.1 hypothetical protein PV326_009985 [Microctonus aethiopoides]
MGESDTCLARLALKPTICAQKCVKARALYDNIAEAPDELAFRKGDVLTVLEQNTAGLEGWWLCALRGRQGICPGNRLRLLVGQYDNGGCLGGSRVDLTLNEDGLQRHGKRRSWHVQPNRPEIFVGASNIHDYTKNFYQIAKQT